MENKRFKIDMMIGNAFITITSVKFLGVTKVGLQAEDAYCSLIEKQVDVLFNRAPRN